MELHVKFDVDSVFEPAGLTDELLGKIIKVTSINFIKDPDSLQSMIDNTAALTLLVQNPEGTENLLELPIRHRLYTFDGNKEDLEDPVYLALKTRFDAFQKELNIDEDGHPRILAFPVYVVIINSSIEDVEEAYGSEEDDDAILKISLEQIAIVKPETFIQTMFAMMFKTIDGHLEDDFLNLESEVKHRESYEVTDDAPVNA